MHYLCVLVLLGFVGLSLCRSEPGSVVSSTVTGREGTFTISLDGSADVRYDKAVAVIATPDMDIVSVRCTGSAGMHLFISDMDSLEVPWTLALGDHEFDAELTRDEIFALLNRSAYYVGPVDAGDILGAPIHHGLPVYAYKGASKPALVVWGFDTSHNCTSSYVQEEGCIDTNAASFAFNEASSNGWNYVPGVAFTHIPQREWHSAAGSSDVVIGDRYETSPAPPSSEVLDFPSSVPIRLWSTGHLHRNSAVMPADSYDGTILLAHGVKTGLCSYTMGAERGSGGRVIVAELGGSTATTLRTYESRCHLSGRCYDQNKVTLAMSNDKANYRGSVIEPWRSGTLTSYVMVLGTLCVGVIVAVFFITFCVFRAGYRRHKASKTKLVVPMLSQRDEVVTV
ncbi:hypothetical protein KIPB_001265 [Kipferlia bialata]|uniref:Calcineurin-like phosphoesterase domain-containing protein n=1 Tax=Kipferlia bialata TaxID=797122 RepID=A0A9K3CNI3_9EUKA|nr:hypothetical protein KIPB_001265 [Kipferlia bialata]|eukprot:g1265.t1